MFKSGKFYKNKKSNLCLKIIGRVNTDCSGRMCVGERLNSQVLFAVKDNESKEWITITYNEWENSDVSLKDHVLMESYLGGEDYQTNKNMRDEFDITF